MAQKGVGHQDSPLLDTGISSYISCYKWDLSSGLWITLDPFWNIFFSVRKDMAPGLDGNSLHHTLSLVRWLNGFLLSLEVQSSEEIVCPGTGAVLSDPTSRA